MKKLLALLLSFMMMAQLPVTTAFASFDDQRAGARASGMADAFVAVADDADSIAYNPAGLIQLMEGQLTSQYGQLVKGLDDGSSLSTTYLGYAYPLVLGYKVLGVAYNNYKADNLFNERTMTLSYARRLDLERYGLRGIYSFGGNLKQLHREYSPDRFAENALNDSGVASNQQDRLFSSGNTKDTYAADAGFLAQFGPQYQYTAGASVINLNQPDVSLGGDGDKAPMSVKMALAYRPKWGTVTVENRRTERLKSQVDSDVLLGVERQMAIDGIGAFLLRAGYGTGSRGYKATTLGMSYLFSRFRFDYAFAFPINGLPGASSTHRAGFAVKMGGANSGQLTRDYSNFDLLDAFAYDSLTSHILLTRIGLARNMPPDLKEMLMLLLVRKYPLDDAGLRDVRGDLRDLMRKYAANPLEWPEIKAALSKGLVDDDRLTAYEAMELLVKNDPKSTLSRISLLPIEEQKNDRISSLSTMALGELSAQMFRRNDLDGCIDYVRRLLEIMPTDKVVVKAYRDLMARRSRIINQSTTREEPVKQAEELPEAPRELVAPEPVAKTTTRPVMSEFESLVRAYGNSIGYYFQRKASGADRGERLTLLNQIIATYGNSQLDLSLVRSELESLNKTQLSVETPAVKPIAPAAVIAPEPATSVPAVQPTPVLMPKSPAKTPTATPAQKPTPQPVNKPEMKPVVKPTPRSEPRSAEVWTDPEMQRAWDFYRDATARDISDHERIELLEGMLRRFGERGADRINKELQRIQRRVNTDGE